MLCWAPVLGRGLSSSCLCSFPAQCFTLKGQVFLLALSPGLMQNKTIHIYRCSQGTNGACKCIYHICNMNADSTK